MRQSWITNGSEGSITSFRVVTDNGKEAGKRQLLGFERNFVVQDANFHGVGLAAGDFLVPKTTLSRSFGPECVDNKGVGDGVKVEIYVACRQKR